MRKWSKRAILRLRAHDFEVICSMQRPLLDPKDLCLNVCPRRAAVDHLLHMIVTIDFLKL